MGGAGEQLKENAELLEEFASDLEGTDFEEFEQWKSEQEDADDDETDWEQEWREEMNGRALDALGNMPL
jgi:Ran GTPase-activating protein (RanGAP) involved in mRNA processing and transport